VSDVGHEVFDVGTGEAVECCEGEGGVFCYAGAIDLKFRDIHSEQMYAKVGGWRSTYKFSCSSTFGDGYFLRRALELGDWVMH
jgi:hypothetical protein